MFDIDIHGKFTSKWSYHSDHIQVIGFLGI